MRDLSTNNMLSINHCKVKNAKVTYEECSFIHEEKYLSSVSVCWWFDCFFEYLPVMLSHLSITQSRTTKTCDNSQGSKVENTDSALVPILMGLDLTFLCFIGDVMQGQQPLTQFSPSPS